MPTPCYVPLKENSGAITAGAFTADSVGNIYAES